MNNNLKYIEYAAGNSKYYEKCTEVAKEYSIKTDDNNGWQVNNDDPIWKFHYIPGLILPMQGWKIHVSTVMHEAEKTLECVSGILIKLEIPFKHVKSRNILFNMYSKNGNRVSAGKFITIYPQAEEFIELLEVLEKELSGFCKGPYILTDKQWKDTNVYFRYGAFKKMICDTGELCIMDDKGNLVPDVRKPQYYIPEFVKVPAKLKEAEVITNNENSEENKLKYYRVTKALRFTNSGGIYLAERIEDSKKCVLKEARAEIGLDGQNRTAESRLKNEYDTLDKLLDVENVVSVIDYFKVWDNTFLVEEFVEGIQLAQWIAINYPFSTNDDIEGYFNNIVKIMNKLKDIVSAIHEKGIAMCDLQTQNVLVDDNLNVKLVDFEIASDIDSELPTGMATKGYFHIFNKRASEKDWYSLNRIFQYAFLPIGPVTDIDVNLNSVHCYWIKKNFGDVAYKYFLDYQLECCRHLSNAKDIFKDTYESEGYANLTHDLVLISERLLKGVLDNCNIENESLINGDIRQFELDCGMLNILNGGFGAILVLGRKNALTADIKIWIECKITELLETDYNNGFLSGRSGIAATLYECGYHTQACELIDLIIKKYDREALDLTMRSGLAGIGLVLVAFYEEEHNQVYLSEAEIIADMIFKKISEGEKIITTDWDSVQVGIIDGYSGISLFYTLLYKVLKNVKYLEFAKKLILMDIDNSNISDIDGSMQTFDVNKNRLLPYLSNGSIGMGVAIEVYHQMSGQAVFQNELTAITKVVEYRCCFDSGLLDGAGGFFIINAFNNLNDDIIEKSIERLELFMIENEGKLLVPGKWFYKLSSDMYSGSAGILLALQTAQSKNVLYWLPMLHKLINKKGGSKQR